MLQSVPRLNRRCCRQENTLTASTFIQQSCPAMLVAYCSRLRYAASHGACRDVTCGHYRLSDQIGKPLFQARGHCRALGLQIGYTVPIFVVDSMK